MSVPGDRLKSKVDPVSPDSNTSPTYHANEVSGEPLQLELGVAVSVITSASAIVAVAGVSETDGAETFAVAWAVALTFASLTSTSI